MAVTVIATQYETPKMVATAVAREDATHWWVRCEGAGCPNVITVGKRHWIPTDFRDVNSPCTEVRLSAPAARRCGLCGPFA